MMVAAVIMMVVVVVVHAHQCNLPHAHPTMSCICLVVMVVVVVATISWWMCRLLHSVRSLSRLESRLAQSVLQLAETIVSDYQFLYIKYPFLKKVHTTCWCLEDINQWGCSPWEGLCPLSKGGHCLWSINLWHFYREAHIFVRLFVLHYFSKVFSFHFLFVCVCVCLFEGPVINTAECAQNVYISPCSFGEELETLGFHTWSGATIDII